MNAAVARTLTQRYQEPQTLAKMLSQIKAMAKIGFSNTSFVFDDRKKASRFAKQLDKKGFGTGVYSYNPSKPEQITLEVQW